MAYSAVIFLTGLLFRLLNYRAVFPGDGSCYLFDPDCYMRLRKVQVYLAAFPKPFVHDYFQGFPHGTGIISAPVMEYLLAALLFPFTGSSVNELGLATGMAFIPPILGGLTAVAVYRLVREAAGEFAGVCAGLLLAGLPVHIETTLLGRFDNEMTEALLLTLVLLYYFRTYRSTATTNWLAFGALQTIFVLLWRGALLPLTVVGLDLTFRSLWSREPIRPLRAAAGYLLPAVVFFLICATDLWGTGNSLNFNIISWFHVILFTLAAAIIAQGHWRHRPDSGNRRPLLAAGALLLLGVGLLYAPLSRGMLVAAGDDAWLGSIVQYLPLYRDPAGVLLFGLVPIMAMVLIPVAGKEINPGLPRRFLAGSLLAFLILALLRRRYGHFFAVEAIIAAGFTLPWLRNQLARRFRMSRIRAGYATAAICLALQLPTAAALAAIRNDRSDILRGDLEQALIWLRDKTPSAGDHLRPDRKPGYSVLGNWDLGGYLETIARRPSVATSYGAEAYGMTEAARFFLADNRTDLDDVLTRNSVRYVLLYNPIDKIAMYSELLNAGNRYVVDRWDSQRRRFAYQPTAEAMNLAVIRMFVADGSQLDVNGLAFAPLSGMRLVYESADRAELGDLPLDVRQAKVFEKTIGARIVLPQPPGCRAYGEQQVVTNQNRTFTFRNAGTPAGAGRVEINLPYPPRRDQDSVGATGPATLVCGNRSATVAVSAGDVESGREIQASWR